uniref:Secreted protein n=1 Tax=Parastrongyloides trichosuri TaxID=131310 RepID=A0A0N4ZFB2_PARTI
MFVKLFLILYLPSALNSSIQIEKFTIKDKKDKCIGNTQNNFGDEEGKCVFDKLAMKPACLSNGRLYYWSEVCNGHFEYLDEE